jgi:hypothetical protein
MRYDPTTRTWWFFFTGCFEPPPTRRVPDPMDVEDDGDAWSEAESNYANDRPATFNDSDWLRLTGVEVMSAYEAQYNPTPSVVNEPDVIQDTPRLPSPPSPPPATSLGLLVVAPLVQEHMWEKCTNIGVVRGTSVLAALH